ncbi:unnamed protein product [Miscanthus lutarioriparius]|uniref:GST N-terminal domain-containing protein n=1 Tax=Miscanthus lutarioriparius TaxID=422564 RepID=A0A811QCD4_9POAL|nr:unnamed protein product [Miscanthus lutarioriparius]
MSPIKVYAHRWSQPCRAVIIFCRVNKIDFEEVTVDLFKSQSLTPEFKKINPMGQVPAIVDGRFKLFESHAILRYLASVFPGVADHWPRPDATKHAEKVLMQSLARIESVWLKGDAKFLLGSPQPSIADLSLVCEIMQLEALGDDMRNKFLGGHERILTWIDNVRKTTSPHFDEAHMFLFEVKAQMQSKAATAAAKQGGSEASSKLKFASKL